MSDTTQRTAGDPAQANRLRDQSAPPKLDAKSALAMSVISGYSEELNRLTHVAEVDHVSIKNNVANDSTVEFFKSRSGINSLEVVSEYIGKELQNAAFKEIANAFLSAIEGSQSPVTIKWLGFVREPECLVWYVCLDTSKRGDDEAARIADLDVFYKAEAKAAPVARKNGWRTRLEAVDLRWAGEEPSAMVPLIRNGKVAYVAG